MYQTITYIMIVLGLASVGGLMTCIFRPERGSGLIDAVGFILIIYIAYRVIDRNEME